MKYISTRGKSPALSFIEVVNSGLAPDGGLYVPESFSQFSVSEIESWKKLSYQQLMEKVISPFIGNEIPSKDLRNLIDKSYKTFRHNEIAPLHKLSDKQYILELFHGPTLAFKDFALQFLGNLLDYILEKKKEDIVIVGATSGDTGSAAIEGCKNCKHINLFMLHPHGRVSDVQRLQMTTVASDNIHNIAVKTDFDGCQSMVKEMFSSADFVKGKKLVAVNSINWARIMAQIVYYFYAALQLGAPEKEIAFSVPTGNFGDIYAGYVALKMGLPISKLIVATNKNDILHRFFKNNDYSKSQVTPTLSPSMDIQISSNFERLLFDLHGHNGPKISELMERFKNTGKLAVEEKILKKSQEIFASNSTDDDAIRKTIKNVHSEYDYIIDPHTATGVAAAEKFQDDPVIILSTAHPAKFPEAIKNVLGKLPERPSPLKNIENKPERYDVLEDDIDEVKKYIVARAG